MSKALQALYARIPRFDCIPGCNDCCEPVPFTESEWAAVKHPRAAEGDKCAFVVEGGCAIYEHRPLVCRLFGASDLLPCPHGCRPVLPLTNVESEETIGQYRAICRNRFVLQSRHKQRLKELGL